MLHLWLSVHDRFLHNQLADSRILLKKYTKLVADNTLNGSPCFGVAQFLLCLAFKLRLPDLDADNGRQTFTDIFTCQTLVRCLSEAYSFWHNH